MGFNSVFKGLTKRSAIPPVPHVHFLVCKVTPLCLLYYYLSGWVRLNQSPGYENRNIPITVLW